MVGRLKLLWVVASVSIAIGAAALLAVLPVGAVKAADPIMDDCEACHLPPIPIFGIERPTSLKGHDKLGDGDSACAACHDKDNKHLRMLNRADGTQIPFSSVPKLCGQCHQARYAQWLEGTHGVPQWSEGVVGLSAAQNNTAWPAGQYNMSAAQNDTENVLAAILKVQPNFLGDAKKICTDCHDPHAPQVVLTSVIKPHPVAAPAPPPAPVVPFVVLGGGLLLAIGVGAAIGWKGEKS